MDTAIASLAADVRSAIYYLILMVSSFGGGWYALSGLIHWREYAAGTGDVQPRQFLSEILVGSAVFGVTRLFSAMGGEAFSATANTSGYALVSTIAGDATATAALNNSLASAFAICAALGWLAQLSALVLAYDLGRGKNDISIWRLVGMLIGGGVLADMSDFVKAIDQTMGLGIFT